MKPRHYYVLIDTETLTRLQSLIAVRFRFYGRIQVFRVERNNVIKAESLCIQCADQLSADVRDDLLSFVGGFIEGANLGSSTSHLGVTEPSVVA